MHSPRCTVAFTDSQGIRHEVEVWASSVFVAVGEAVEAFRRDGIADSAPGGMTEMTITVHRPPVVHKVAMKQVANWAEAGGKTPRETLERNRVRKQLG